MTRTTSARVAGFTFLLYIAVAFPAMVLFGRATRGDGPAAKLASIAEHTGDLRFSVLLGIVSCFCALVLGVTLYGITRDEDHELALLACLCRVGEGLVGAVPVTTLGLVSLAATGGQKTLDDASGTAIAGLLFKWGDWSTTTAAILFAVGSTLFAWLLLRGRLIPRPLAWLGVLASALLVIVLPLDLAGLLGAALSPLVWIPIAGFELAVGPWLLFKGVPGIPRGQAP
jgi:hypothetical protein